jgi:hypothetical protein
MELVLHSSESRAHFSFLCDIADAFMQYCGGKFDPKRYSFIGHIMEEIVKIEFSGRPRTNSQSTAVDLVLPNGSTMQVKTSHVSRNEITCTYAGTENVDTMLVLNVDTANRKIYILYHGPFKQFVTHINAVTRALPKDGHITPKKSVVVEAQEKFGYSEFSATRHLIEEFL